MPIILQPDSGRRPDQQTFNGQPTDVELVRATQSLRSQWRQLEDQRLTAQGSALGQIEAAQDQIIGNLESLYSGEQNVTGDRGALGTLFSVLGAAEAGLATGIYNLGFAIDEGVRALPGVGDDGVQLGPVSLFAQSEDDGFQRQGSFGEVGQTRQGDAGNRSLALPFLPDPSLNRLYGAAGIVLDPLNFVGVGALNRAGQAGADAARAAGVIGDGRAAGFVAANTSQARRLSYRDIADQLNEAGEHAAAARVMTRRSTEDLSTEYLARFNIDRRFNIGLGRTSVALAGTEGAARSAQRLSGGVRRVTRDNKLVSAIADGSRRLGGNFRHAQWEAARRLVDGEITEDMYRGLLRVNSEVRSIGSRTQRVAATTIGRMADEVDTAARRAYQAYSEGIIDGIEDVDRLLASITEDGRAVLRMDDGALIEVTPILDAIARMADELERAGRSESLLGLPGAQAGLSGEAAGWRLGYFPRRIADEVADFATPTDALERAGRERVINPGEVINGQEMRDVGLDSSLGLPTGTVSRAQIREVLPELRYDGGLIDQLDAYGQSAGRLVATTEAAARFVAEGLAVPVDDLVFRLPSKVAHTTVLEALHRTRAMAAGNMEDVGRILAWESHHVSDIMDDPEAFVSYLFRARSALTEAGRPRPRGTMSEEAFEELVLEAGGDLDLAAVMFAREMDAVGIPAASRRQWHHFTDAIENMRLARLVDDPTDSLNLMMRARESSLRGLLDGLPGDVPDYEDLARVANAMSAEDATNFMTLFSTGDTLLGEIATSLGIPTNLAGDEVAALGEKVFMQDSLARALNTRLTMRPEREGFSRFMSGSVRIWKRWATFSPSYNIRNAYGGTVAEFAAGHTLVDLNKAVKYVTDWFNADDAGRQALAFVPADERDAFRQVVARGDAFATGSTRLGTESALGERTVAEGITRAAERGRTRLDGFGSSVVFGAVAPTRAGDLARGVVSAGRETAVPVETVLRASHIMARMRRGFNYEAARDSMYRYQFDYSDLSDFERGVQDFAIPFYTFAARNIALQMELLLRRPQLMTDLARFERISQERNGSPLHPEWHSDYLTIYLSDGRRSITPDVPFNDLVKRYEDLRDADVSSPSTLIQPVLNEASPLLKVAALALNADEAFEGYDIDGEIRTDQGRYGPVFEVLGGIMHSFGMAETEGVPDGVVLIDNRIRYGLNNLFPILQRMNSMADGSDVTGEDTAVEWLNFIFGGFRYTTDRQRVNSTYEYTEEAQRILDRMRRYGNASGS